MKKEKTLEISVFLMYWFVLNAYFTSVKLNKVNFWYSGSILAYFSLFLMKIYLILMKLIEISWNFIFRDPMKTLILKHFEIRWNKWCPNQVLRKLVKLHNSQNVNQYDYINVSKHSRVYLMGAFFVFFEKVHLKVYLILTLLF